MEEIVLNKPIDVVEMKILNVLKERNIKVFDIIDQRKEAEKVGLKIPFTRLIIFGDPKVGTLLMQKNNLITFDLPLKLLLIEHKGQTKIIYRKPESFAQAKALDDEGKEIIQKIATLYETLIEAAKN